MSKRAGKVYLVGAGPGDPGLLTRRGEALLAAADVVVYDQLASARLLDLAPAAALRIRADKSTGHSTPGEREIDHIMIEHARAGESVVRLKGGDPLIFGRGAEEALHLRAAGIPFEIVPGVTAAVGVAAYAGIPLTHRGKASAVALVTGHLDPETDPARSRLDWQALARFPGTLVVYMGVARLGAICRTLLRLGKAGDTPAAVIAAGTLAAQRTTVATLETIAQTVRKRGISPPALLVVGAVVGMRQDLAWYEMMPLFGQRIVITRPAAEGRRAAIALEALGAETLLAPTVVIRPLANPAPLDAALERLAEYGWLVFTSANGVRYFVERLEQRGADLRILGHVKLAAIGPATAQALARFHLRADLVPDSYRSEALAEALGGHVRGTKILLARADRGRAVLKEELQKRADVDQIAVYQSADVESLPPCVVERILDGSVDWITLTSSAITTRLHSLLPEAARRRVGAQVRLASLSPVTSETAARLGWNASVEASAYTWDGLVDALVEHVARERGSLDQRTPVPPA
jgi:uroporphyrinogen III methyltransferase/synthase